MKFSIVNEIIYLVNICRCVHFSVSYFCKKTKRLEYLYVPYNKLIWPYFAGHLTVFTSFDMKHKHINTSTFWSVQNDNDRGIYFTIGYIDE
jgi:hypothetical protein